MSTQTILAFVTIAGILVITPGADTMLVVRSVMSHGRRAGFLTIGGITAGCTVHAALSAAGVSAILAASARAFDGLKIAGAVYLILLGLHAAWTALTTATDDANQTNHSEPRLPLARGFRDGFVTNILNPKVAIFYLAFVPQFIDPTADVVSSFALLAAVHMAMGVLWLSTLTFAVGWMRQWLARSGTKRGFELLSGVTLVGLGVRLAIARR